jgi:IS1 family transposase
MAFQRISKDKQALILAAMCEGMAINSVCRTFKVGKHAVLRVLKEIGEACEDWHNRNFRDLTVAEIEIDEQWAYVGVHKERMSKAQKQANPELGDVWLWASIDRASRAILNWRSGKRTAKAATAFAFDLASRVPGRVQITSDQLNSYKFVIPGAFGDRVDYAQEHKIFQSSTAAGHEWMRYKTNPLVGVEREAICGNPNLSTATVCHMERYFLTMRQSNKRCARKTLAYSKKFDNHALASSIQIFIYNMVRKHETLKDAPAVALGIIQKRWTLEDVVTMAEAYRKNTEEDAFEAAFAGFQTQPTARRTYAPSKPLAPWYLDPTSGGPNPEVKKAGIAYEDTEA